MNLKSLLKAKGRGQKKGETEAIGPGRFAEGYEARIGYEARMWVRK